MINLTKFKDFKNLIDFSRLLTVKDLFKVFDIQNLDKNKIAFLSFVFVLLWKVLKYQIELLIQLGNWVFLLRLNITVKKQELYFFKSTMDS